MEQDILTSSLMVADGYNKAQQLKKKINESGTATPFTPLSKNSARKRDLTI